MLSKHISPISPLFGLEIFWWTFGLSMEIYGWTQSEQAQKLQWSGCKVWQFLPCPCYCSVELQPFSRSGSMFLWLAKFQLTCIWGRLFSPGSSPLMKLKLPWSIALSKTHFTGLDLTTLSQLCHLVKLITSLQFLEPFSGGHSNMSKFAYYHTIYVLGQLFRTRSSPPLKVKFPRSKALFKTSSDLSLRERVDSTQSVVKLSILNDSTRLSWELGPSH